MSDKIPESTTNQTLLKSISLSPTPTITNTIESVGSSVVVGGPIVIDPDQPNKADVKFTRGRLKKFGFSFPFSYLFRFANFVKPNQDNWLVTSYIDENLR